MMTEADLIKALSKALNDNRAIDNETHKEHHDYIRMAIAREQRKQERWDRVKTKVIGYGIISVLSGTGYAVWQYLLSMKNGHH